MTVLCKDCRHFKDSIAWGRVCDAEPTRGEPDPVSGFRSYQLCTTLRQPSGVCGPEGKLYLQDTRWFRC